MQSPKLFTVHNLFDDKLHYADQLGGLACPSFAVIRSDIPYTQFGHITLIANKQMVNPSRVAVFDTDVYSSRFPTIHFKANKKAAERLAARHQDSFEKIGQDFPLESAIQAVKKEGAQTLVDELKDYSGMKLAYLHAMGRNPRLPFKTPDMKHELSSHPRIKAWFKRQPNLDFQFNDPRAVELGKIMQDIYEKEAHEDASESARKRAQFFDKDEQTLYQELHQLYLDAGMKHLSPTPDGFAPHYHVLRDMVSDHEALLSGEKVFDAKAFKTQQQNYFEKNSKAYRDWLFNEIKYIPVEPYFYHTTSTNNRVKKALTLESLTRSLRGSIRDAEGFVYGVGNIRSGLAHQFKNFGELSGDADRIVSHEQFETEKNRIKDELDRLAEEITPYYLYDSKGFGYYDKARQNISEFVTTGRLPDYKEVPEETLQALREFAYDLKHAPTEYFEAKLQRSVTLDEFVGAVVPKNTPADTFAILKKHGIPYKLYEYNNERSRIKAMQHFAEHAFGDLSHVHQTDTANAPSASRDNTESFTP